MELTITMIILVAWLALWYALFIQLSRTHKIILVSATVITASLFYYDSVHDKPSTPYTLAETLQEIMVTGSIYMLIIFFTIYGIRLIVGTLSK